MQSFRIIWSDEKSRAFCVQKSVRQGGVLSPYFFNLYMDGLEEKLDASGLGCRINGSFVNNIWYADDLVLLAPSIFALQRLIDICSDYACKHNILFNGRKTVCMRFESHGKNKIMYKPKIELKSSFLNWVNSYSYLGYQIDNSSKKYDDNEIQRKYYHIKVRANMLASRFSKTCEIVRRQLFLTYFSSIYCCSLWVTETQKVHNLVKVAYNNCFRILFKIRGPHSISNEFVNRRLNTFDRMRRRNCYSLCNRVMQSNNIVISSLVDNEDFCNNPMYKERTTVSKPPDHPTFSLLHTLQT